MTTINIATASTAELVDVLDLIDTIVDLYGYLPAEEAWMRPQAVAELLHRGAASPWPAA